LRAPAPKPPSGRFPTACSHLCACSPESRCPCSKKNTCFLHPFVTTQRSAKIVVEFF
jgi:hypothetical protein